jgi:hypothetical protein
MGRCSSTTCSPSRSPAEEGYALASIGDAIRKVEQLFTDEWTTSVDVYLPAPEPGELHRNRALAETYRRILAEAEAASTDRDAQLEAAHDSWYRGFVAEEIVRFQEREWLDSSGERHAGLLAEDDLRDWVPRWEDAISIAYGYGLQGRPMEPALVCLRSSGYSGSTSGGVDHASAEWLHTSGSAQCLREPRALWVRNRISSHVPSGLLSRGLYVRAAPRAGSEESPPSSAGARQGGRRPARWWRTRPVAPGVGAGA